MKLYYNRNSKDPIYYAQQGIRIGSKTTTKNVKRFGRHSELLEITDDPLAYVKEEIRKMNEQARAEKEAAKAAAGKKKTSFETPAPTSGEQSTSVIGYADQKSGDISSLFHKTPAAQTDGPTIESLLLKYVLRDMRPEEFFTEPADRTLFHDFMLSILTEATRKLYSVKPSGQRSVFTPAVPKEMLPKKPDISPEESRRFLTALEKKKSSYLNWLEKNAFPAGALAPADTAFVSAWHDGSASGKTCPSGATSAKAWKSDAVSAKAWKSDAVSAKTWPSGTASAKAASAEDHGFLLFCPVKELARQLQSIPADQTFRQIRLLLVTGDEQTEKAPADMRKLLLQFAKSKSDNKSDNVKAKKGKSGKNKSGKKDKNAFLQELDRITSKGKYVGCRIFVTSISLSEEEMTAMADRSLLMAKTHPGKTTACFLLLYAMLVIQRRIVYLLNTRGMI